MTQLLLSTAVTITTILLVIVSVQLISLLKHLKNEHIHTKNVSVKPQDSSPKTVKKKVSLLLLLEKMKTRISHPHSNKKTFFKSS